MIIISLHTFTYHCHICYMWPFICLCKPVVKACVPTSPLNTRAISIIWRTCEVIHKPMWPIQETHESIPIPKYAKHKWHHSLLQISEKFVKFLWNLHKFPRNLTNFSEICTNFSEICSLSKCPTYALVDQESRGQWEESLCTSDLYPHHGKPHPSHDEGKSSGAMALSKASKLAELHHTNAMPLLIPQQCHANKPCIAPSKEAIHKRKSHSNALQSIASQLSLHQCTVQLKIHIFNCVYIYIWKGLLQGQTTNLDIIIHQPTQHSMISLSTQS